MYMNINFFNNVSNMKAATFNWLFKLSLPKVDNPTLDCWSCLCSCFFLSGQGVATTGFPKKFLVFHLKRPLVNLRNSEVVDKWLEPDPEP